VTSLRVADDETWWTALGVVPAAEARSGDELVRELIYPVTDSGAVHVTWDVTDSSVRVRHRRAEATVTDLFREMATLVTVAGTAAMAEILIEYGSPAYSGRLRVRVFPEVHVEDTLVRS
jgi:hypothetical protein